MTTNEKQNKQPEAGKKELTPRQIQMRKKMVVFPLFFLAFAGCMWLIFSPGEKEREEPSAGFNTELPTPESEVPFALSTASALSLPPLPSPSP